MSQEQAKYLCESARQSIDAAIVQGWALAFPTAFATLDIAANYLGGAANEMGGGDFGAELIGLGNEVAAKGNEILAIGVIPWPFVYAALGPWSNGLRNIRDRIPDIVVLEPARTSRPAIADASGLSQMVNYGKGPRGYQRSDDRIRNDVCEVLTLDPWVDASHVDVVVTAGRATLQGRFNNDRERRRAEELTAAVPGVVGVASALDGASHPTAAESQISPQALPRL